MNLYSGEAAIKSGDSYAFRDNKTARLWYKIALDDELTRNIAIKKLLELERKMGNYKVAREYANMLLECKDKELYYYLGRVEHAECNLLSALDYYSMFFSSSSLSFNDQFANLKLIANIYTQLGEFEVARRMYETLLYNSKFKNMGLLELINLDIIQGDYIHGLELYRTVETRNQSYIDLLQRYYLILMYNLGRINELNEGKFGNYYTYKRLILNDNSILLKHIESHCRLSNLIEIIFNSKDTVNEILKNISDIVKNVNPFYSTGSLKYKCRLDYNIGEHNGNMVDGIEVVMINNKVFTMYPLCLSSSFDREGILHNEELNKKRIMGVRK